MQTLLGVVIEYQIDRKASDMKIIIWRSRHDMALDRVHPWYSTTCGYIVMEFVDRSHGHVCKGLGVFAGRLNYEGMQCPVADFDLHEAISAQDQGTMSVTMAFQITGCLAWHLPHHSSGR